MPAELGFHENIKGSMTAIVLERYDQKNYVRIGPRFPSFSTNQMILPHYPKISENPIYILEKNLRVFSNGDTKYGDL